MADGVCEPTTEVLKQIAVLVQQTTMFVYNVCVLANCVCEKVAEQTSTFLKNDCVL